MNVFVLILAFVGIFKNRKNNNSLGIFFTINALIYFGVYLLIEVNARYYYNPQIAVILLGGLGLDKVISVCRTVASESKTFSHFVNKLL